MRKMKFGRVSAILAVTAFLLVEISACGNTDDSARSFDLDTVKYQVSRLKIGDKLTLSSGSAKGGTLHVNSLSADGRGAVISVSYPGGDFISAPVYSGEPSGSIRGVTLALQSPPDGSGILKLGINLTISPPRLSLGTSRAPMIKKVVKVNIGNSGALEVGPTSIQATRSNIANAVGISLITKTRGAPLEWSGPARVGDSISFNNDYRISIKDIHIVNSEQDKVGVVYGTTSIAFS